MVVCSRGGQLRAETLAVEPRARSSQTSRQLAKAPRSTRAAAPSRIALASAERRPSPEKLTHAPEHDEARRELRAELVVRDGRRRPAVAGREDRHPVTLRGRKDHQAQAAHARCRRAGLPEHRTADLHVTRANCQHGRRAYTHQWSFPRASFLSIFEIDRSEPRPPPSAARGRSRHRRR